MKTRVFLLLFVLVSVLDTAFTFLLIKEAHHISWTIHSVSEESDTYNQPESYETNPISRSVLKNYGVEGMLIYKISLVIMICGVAIVAQSHSKRMSTGLSLFAFVVTGMVAMYGLAGLILFYYPNIIS